MNELKFKEQISIKYNDKYDLSKIWFRNMYYHIFVICPIHGEFKIRPSHMLERACRKCKDKPLELVQEKITYYDYTKYLQDQTEGFLYLVKLINKETKESFYKIRSYLSEYL